MAVRQKWNTIYQQQTDSGNAAEVLRQNQHLLPAQGKALELACGRGANAILLAQHGLNVAAWDIADVAIADLTMQASQMKLSIMASQRDVVSQPPPANSFDVIVVSLFLERSLCPAIAAALKPGGLLFYQTYCQQKVTQIGPSNSDYLLADNELLSLFTGLKLRVYREESLLGDTDKGWRNQAMLVAEKP